MTKIKVCGLSREEDIDIVNRQRPDYVGFILNYPKSRRNISPETAMALRSRLSPGIRAVGVFVNQGPETVAELAEMIGLDVIQLHGRENEAYIAALREKTGRPVWKAFRVRSREDLEAAWECSADEVLLDNGYGTGECFDWSLVRSPGRPFILAGGLDEDNVGHAIRKMRPRTVDVSSGVEKGGFKDEKKIAAFIAAVRKEAI